MYSVVFLSLLVFVAAAPHYHHYNDDFSCEYHDADDSFYGFKELWQDMQRMIDQLRGQENVFQSTYYQNVGNNRQVNVLVEGNHYIVSMFLPGYKKSDIRVTWKKPDVVVYVMNYRNRVWAKYHEMALPENVSRPGQWSFKNNILIIKFDMESTQTDQTFADPKVNVNNMIPNNGVAGTRKHSTKTYVTSTVKPITESTIPNIGTQRTHTIITENKSIKSETGSGSGPGVVPTKPVKSSKPATETTTPKNINVKPLFDNSPKDKTETKIDTSTIVPKNFDWSKNYFSEPSNDKDNNKFKPIEY